MYMRCIYTREDFEKVVATGKALVVLKVYGGSKEKLSGECAKAYLSAIQMLHFERETCAQFGWPLRFVMDFSNNNSNRMAFHYYHKKKEVAQVT
uniref:Uncharacterized protein n=1 Tax=Ditylenchus dipsaci TaxID=166011 RepID=A0A915DKJ2_9BILA